MTQVVGNTGWYKPLETRLSLQHALDEVESRYDLRLDYPNGNVARCGHFRACFTGHRLQPFFTGDHFQFRLINTNLVGLAKKLKLDFDGNIDDCNIN